MGELIDHDMSAVEASPTMNRVRPLSPIEEDAKPGGEDQQESIYETNGFHFKEGETLHIALLSQGSTSLRRRTGGKS